MFDVAHNPAAAAQFHATLVEWPEAASTVAVFGAMMDKDIATVLVPFVDQVDRWFLAPLDSERSATTQELQRVLTALGADAVTACADVRAATLAARRANTERILVFGSFYTVGPAMTTVGLY